MKTVIHFLVLVSALSATAATFTAVYEVPVEKNSGLNRVNKFPLTNVQLDKTDDDQVSLKYVLPLELTGATNTLQFTGKLNEFNKADLNYDQSSMKCQDTNASLVCQVKYKNLNTNQALAADLMSRKFSGEELENRLKILSRFSTDPVGIVRIYRNTVFKIQK